MDPVSGRKISSAGATCKVQNVFKAESLLGLQTKWFYPALNSLLCYTFVRQRQHMRVLLKGVKNNRQKTFFTIL